MKKLVFGMIVVASISLTNVFAQTKTECTTSTTTQSNGWDDYIPYWQNNTTKSRIKHLLYILNCTWNLVAS